MSAIMLLLMLFGVGESSDKCYYLCQLGKVNWVTSAITYAFWERVNQVTNAITYAFWGRVPQMA